MAEIIGRIEGNAEGFEEAAEEASDALFDLQKDVERIAPQIADSVFDIEKATEALSRAFEDLGKEAGDSAKFTRDSLGRLRDEFGKFVKDADKLTAIPKKIKDIGGETSALAGLFTKATSAFDAINKPINDFLGKGFDFQGFFSDFKKGFGIVSSAVSGAINVFQSLIATFTKLAAIGGATVGAIALGLTTLAERGKKVESVTASFEALTAQSRISADTLVAQLQTATGGAVSKLELMQTANKLLAAQLPVTQERFVALAQAAVKLGQATGLTATESVKRLTDAIAKQSPELLDELGLNVKLEDAIKREAAARGVAKEAIDGQAKTVAFLNAVEEQALTRSAAISGQLGVFSQAVERSKTAFQDFLDRLGLFVVQSPVLTAIFVEVTTAFGQLGQFIEANAPLIASAFDSLVQTARAFAVGFFQNIGLTSGAVTNFLKNVTESGPKLQQIFGELGKQIGLVFARASAFVASFVLRFQTIGEAAVATVAVFGLAVTKLGEILISLAGPVAGIITAFRVFFGALETGFLAIATLAGIQIAFMAKKIGELIHVVNLAVEAFTALNRIVALIPGPFQLVAQASVALGEKTFSALSGIETSVAGFSRSIEGSLVGLKDSLLESAESTQDALNGFGALRENIAGFGDDVRETGLSIQTFARQQAEMGAMAQQQAEDIREVNQAVVEQNRLFTVERNPPPSVNTGARLPSPGVNPPLAGNFIGSGVSPFASRDPRPAQRERAPLDVFDPSLNDLTGAFPGFRRGGIIPGTGRGDKVPIMAEPGELVIPRSGVPFIQGLLGALERGAGGGRGARPITIGSVQIVVASSGDRNVGRDIASQLLRLGELGQDDFEGM